jgi:hypothetical protein
VRGAVLRSVVALVLWVGSHAMAQGPVDAALRGRVVAQDGAAAEARVHVRSSDGGEQVVATSRDGTFFVLRLTPGLYRVVAESSGAGSSAVLAIELQAGEIADVTLRLSPRPVALTSVDARGAEYSGEESLTALPVRGREWEELQELDSTANEASPAAARDDVDSDQEERTPEQASSDDGAPAGGLSYGGISPAQNAEWVDGLSAQQGFRSGPRGAASAGPSSRASFGEGAVRSFRVLPGTFSAQYGGAAGGVVAVVSRAGSARLHGSVFALLRESAWAATNPFSVVTRYNDGAITSVLQKPGGSTAQFGGSVGFPLRHSKAAGKRLAPSLFVSLDARRRDDSIVSSPELASFYQLTPEQTALLGNRGVNAAATHAALSYLDSLAGTVSRSEYRVQGFARFDTAIGGRDRVTLAYIGNRFDSPAGAALGKASDAVVARGTGSLGDSVIHVDVATARWLHVLAARADNEVRGQFAHDLEYETPHLPLPQEPAIGPEGYAPQVSIAPEGFAYGTPASLARAAYPDEQRVELADALQIRFGQHLLRAGADWSRLDDRLNSLTNAEGSFSYDSGTTGGHDGGLVDWITDYTFNVRAYPNGGCPSINAAVHYFCFRSFTQSFGPTQTEFVTHEVAGFAEDSWRARENLVVTVGGRYEYTLLPLPQTPNRALDAVIADLGGRVGGATASFPEDRNNVGPRLAVAWSPRWMRRREPLFTVHVGYGAFYGRMPGATIAAALTDTALPATTQRIRITPTTITNCPQVTTGNQGFGYPCDFLMQPPAVVATTGSAKLFSRSFRLPAVQRASLALERELGRSGFVRASYAMATATQLPTTVDLNIAPSPGLRSFVLQGGAGHAGLREGETFVVPFYDARVVSQYGPVTAIVSHANATYHAATMEAMVRPSRELEVRGSYTFSRAIDYAPQSGAIPGVDAQFDPFADGYDKGLSSLQFPQRFAGDMLYSLQMTRGPEVVRRMLSGLRFSAIATAGSGAPYTYAVFGGTYLNGGRDTINGSGGATYLPTVGRNTLRLPMRSHVSVRVAREFAVRDGLRLSVFAQAFNLLNTQSVSRVETRGFLVGTAATPGAPTPLIFQDAATVANEEITTPAFGTALSSTGGLSRERQAEAGLRVTF